MFFMGPLKRFSHDDKGNVTIDWVVVTAGVAALAVAVLLSVGDSTIIVTNDMADAISSAHTAN